MPVDTRGEAQTYWTKMGHGARKALMIHCSLGHSGAWRGVTGHLDEMLDATAFDLPGHGNSADWDGRRDFQDVSLAMAVDLLDGPVDVIGHSFGGTVALRLAVERPDLVRSLVLIEPVFFAAAFADNPEMQAAHAAEMAGYNAAIQAGDNETAAREFTASWGDGRAWAAMPDAARAAMALRIPLVHACAPALFDDAAGLLSDEGVTRISQPVLLLEGEASPQYVAAINDALMARIKRSERAVITGAGHMAPMTHPKEVAAAIRGFLETIPEEQSKLP